jgi:hypothetical protein
MHFLKTSLMLKVVYSQESFEELERFISSYKSVFKKLYVDTWLDDEKLIIENYIKVWNLLYEKIITKLEYICSQEKILWISKNYESDYVVVSLERLRIFIYFSENKALKERYIEHLEFFKK